MTLGRPVVRAWLLILGLAMACGSAAAVIAPTHALAENRHSAGFHSLGLYTGGGSDPGTRLGVISAIRGVSSRLHGMGESTYVFTRGDARLVAGRRLGPDDDASEYALTGSLAVGVQLYRVIPVALHLEDIQLEVIGGDPHARVLVGTGATLPFDVIFDLARETVLVGSVFGGVWINQVGSGDEYLAGGARIDFLANHLGAQASTTHLLDNAVHRQKLSVFARDLWGHPVRLGVDYERESSGSHLWTSFIGWGLAP